MTRNKVNSESLPRQWWQKSPGRIRCKGRLEKKIFVNYFRTIPLGILKCLVDYSLQSNSYAFKKPLTQLPLPEIQSGLDFEKGKWLRRPTTFRTVAYPSLSLHQSSIPVYHESPPTIWQGDSHLFATRLFACFLRLLQSFLVFPAARVMCYSRQSAARS